MKINWVSTIGQGQGYSGASEQMAIALEESGIDVRLMQFRQVPYQNITIKGKKLLKKSFMLAPVGICFSFPNAFTSLINPIKIGYTEWETDKLPSIPCDWSGQTGNSVDIINKLNMLWVACNHNKKLFEREGVKIPIEVIPHGVNPEQYPLMKRPKRKTFTFLMLGTLNLRKDPGMALNAFLSLFKDNPDVRIIFKTQSGGMGSIEFPENKNIKIIDKLATHEDMISYYWEADAFVFPSRGEGFGLPPVEAMATGLPCIFTDHTGMSDYANPEINYPIKVGQKIPVVRYPKKWGNVGNWYVADYEDLKAKMKYVVEHREEAYKKGLKASEWVRNNLTYKHTAQKMIYNINKLIKRS